MNASADQIRKDFDDPSDTLMSAAIASAVLAERERCAKLSEESHWDGHGDGIAGRKIAARIRNGVDPLPDSAIRDQERERCAKIAEDYDYGDDGVRHCIALPERIRKDRGSDPPQAKTK